MGSTGRVFRWRWLPHERGGQLLVIASITALALAGKGQAASQWEWKKPKGQEQTGQTKEAEAKKGPGTKDGTKDEDGTKEGEAKQKLPAVLFFVIDASPGPARSAGCVVAVMGAVGRVETRLRKDVKSFKGIDAKAEVVFREKDLDHRLRAAVRSLRLPTRERSEGAMAVFLRCQGAVVEPRKKKDRPETPYEPRRFQAEVKVECEACRVTLTSKRTKKKKPWRRTLEATYLTPEQQPEGQRLETESTAMQRAADMVIEQLFAKREKWLK